VTRQPFLNADLADQADQGGSETYNRDEGDESGSETYNRDEGDESGSETFNRDEGDAGDSRLSPSSPPSLPKSFFKSA
jgi:hypothetical protein